MCRLHPGERNFDEFQQRHEWSRVHSIFNTDLYVLRHLDAAVHCLMGSQLTTWTAVARTSTPLGDVERRVWLRLAGYPEPIIAELPADAEL